MSINTINELIYGRLPYGRLIFALRDDAQRVAGQRRALAQSKTWGEFRASLSPDQRADLEQWLQPFVEEDDFEMPPDDAPFNRDDVPGHADGDWPLWLAQRQMDWVPREIQEEFGTVEDSFLNGFFLTFDPAQEAAILEAFHSHGFTATRDDALITLASGHGTAP